MNHSATTVLTPSHTSTPAPYVERGTPTFRVAGSHPNSLQDVTRCPPKWDTEGKYLRKH